MIRSLASVLMSAFWLCSPSICRAVERCDRLEGSSPRSLLGYLENDRKELDPPCILYAMERLGVQRYTPAAKVLITYLDYPMPQNPKPEPHGRGLLWAGDRYPAANALFLIGQSIIPPLIDVLANEKTPRVIHENALATIKALLAETPPESVAILVRASRDLSRSDAVGGRRLMQAAQEMAGLCIDRWKSDCEIALYQ